MGMRATYTATPKDIEQRWFVVDADGMVLGRLASEVAWRAVQEHLPGPGFPEALRE